MAWPYRSLRRGLRSEPPDGAIPAASAAIQHASLGPNGPAFYLRVLLFHPFHPCAADVHSLFAAARLRTMTTLPETESLSTATIPTAPRPGGIREMLAIAVPMVASNACETVMTFTDRLFLSRLGAEYMAGAMAGGLTCFMLMTLFVGLIGYTTALTAQFYGAGRRGKCAAAAAQAMIIALAAYPIILMLRPVAHAMFERSGISPEQLGPQRIYFDILIWGSLIGLLRVSLSGFFSGIGRTQIVMLASMVAMVSNVLGNYVLIFGKWGFPELGMAGAAYGTVFGSACGLAVLAAGFLRPRLRREFAVLSALRFDWQVMSKLLRYGSPAGVELFLNVLAFSILILAFHSEGLAAATATTIVFNWDMVSFVPLIGLNIAVTSLVGRYMGARDPDTAHRATMSGLRLAWCYSFCTLLAFAFLPHILVGVFRPEGDPGAFAQAEPMAVFMLRLAAIYVLADATILVFSGALRGAGDTLWTMCCSVGVHWLLVGVLLFLLRGLDVRVEMAWLVLCIVILLFCSVFYLRYRQGKWRTMTVVHSVDETGPLVTDGLHEPAKDL